MSDLDSILRRVAAGELDPAAAEPLVAEAMREPSRGARQPSHPDSSMPPGAGHRRPDRNVRIQVTEGGRSVVNLRVPIGLAGLASLLPGLSDRYAARVSEALREGEIGRVVEIQDESGDGVIISTE